MGVLFKKRKRKLTVKRFKIWKADIDSYRVLDRHTGELSVVSDLVAINCLFVVDASEYCEAAKSGFIDSGNPLDCFAWIDADKVSRNTQRVAYPKTVFYNPFKHESFRDKNTFETLTAARIVTTIGNRLTYKL